jgi:hypothetical protein
VRVGVGISHTFWGSRNQGCFFFFFS